MPAMQVKDYLRSIVISHGDHSTQLSNNDQAKSSTLMLNTLQHPSSFM